MKHSKVIFLLTYLTLPLLAFNNSAYCVGENVLTAKLREGKSQVECDFSLGPYYQNRSAESIASEIEANGFDCIHYLVLDPQNINNRLLEELHKRNIGVWASVFATNVYGSKKDLPAKGNQWEMEFVNQSKQGYTHLSFVHKDYCRKMKERLVKLLKMHPFDGFVFMETHFPVLGRLDDPAASFGDISQAFQEQFKRATGNVLFPNFTDPSDSNYYKNSRELFEDLVAYRVKGINDFYNEIINGDNGLRVNFPDLVVGTWSMALSHENSLEFLRTWEGQDAVAMVSLVQPDVHFFQTHWPDWIRPDLPPDYARQYKPFIDSVKQVAPNIHIGLQADIGSHDNMRKTRSWYDDFVKYSRESGIDTTTAYEFILRWEVYHSPPKLIKSILSSPTRQKLIFDQVIDPKSARQLLQREITGYASGNGYIITEVNTDGNMVILSTDRPVESREMLAYPVGGLSDYPEARFPINSNGKTSVEKYGPVNSLPIATFEFSQPEN